MYMGATYHCVPATLPIKNPTHNKPQNNHISPPCSAEDAHTHLSNLNLDHHTPPVHDHPPAPAPFLPHPPCSSKSNSHTPRVSGPPIPDLAHFPAVPEVKHRVWTVYCTS
ncbi:hypothetical protein BDW22DRAFT_1357193 [Trametopsis cervina]|nr:hypothetical protein BDW22DRAFT_1357193 [Trametopsis cervina]